MKHNLKITYSGYKYAPESFTFFVNGKVYATRYPQESHDLAMLIIEGKKEEAINQIKRNIRKSYKKPEYITIGFYEVGTNRYFFTRQLYANKNDLSDKLRIYKEYKHFLQSKNCIVNTYEVKSGQFIPGTNTTAKTQTIEEKADIKRPLIIHLV